MDLLVHCGIRYLKYQRKEYKAVHPSDPPERLPSADGTTTETGYIHGYVHVVNAKAVDFVVADPSVSINGKSIAFQLTADNPPLCA